MIHEMGQRSCEKNYAEWELGLLRNGAKHRWASIVQVDPKRCQGQFFLRKQAELADP
jgi:hypothetical protein